MAISLGGAIAPAATPIVANPNIRVFAVTCLAGDTGPTAFNHGLQASSANDILCWHIPAVSQAAANTPFWALTWTATQVTLSKQGSANSDLGLGVVVCWNTHTAIR